jgi:hypothetical protein
MILPPGARTALSLAIVVFVARTASAQTPSPTGVPLFEVGGGVTINPSSGGGWALSGVARVNFTKSMGVDLAAHVLESSPSHTFGYYVLSSRYSIGTGSARLRAFVSAGMVGTFETFSGKVRPDPARETGDTVVYPAFHYGRTSGPLAGAVGGGVHILLARHLAMDAGAQCWVFPPLSVSPWFEIVPVVATVGVTVTLGKVR